ncbi:MAG: DHH family phosphoesterase [Halieaceae bacterium]|jgi:single-stranded DNA-specific DHH superfamily exonuclease|nr:DHH family phosphoesterase [Halieaceae bacterium]
MADFDVFNGDADGICALLQLRLAEPRDATLVTGVKRDISLLKQVVAAAGDRITALDISLDKNRDALNALLSAGASVFYADHHFPGEIPEHRNLTALIDTAPEVGTCALVNRYLNGAQAAWAVVGTYGDNLDQTAEAIAAAHGLDLDLPRCKELGVLINYNAYGATIDDLHIAPAALFKRLLAFSGPMDVLSGDPELVDRLSAGYDDDMKRAESSPRLLEDDNLAVIELPNEPWARRVSGVYGNHLANYYPDRAHAILTDIPEGYLVSVRAPLNRRTGADDVCRQFATGGGRAAAAGINQLPGDEVDTLIDAMRRQYG